MFAYVAVGRGLDTTILKSHSFLLLPVVVFLYCFPGIQVITKFIQKQKVYQQSWVEDPTLGRKVPLEISLLTTLKHPNIVSITINF
jgi:hypothetical protein